MVFPMGGGGGGGGGEEGEGEGEGGGEGLEDAEGLEGGGDVAPKKEGGGWFSSLFGDSGKDPVNDEWDDDDD